MNTIIFVTGNMNKVLYTSKFTHFPFEHKKIDLDEIQSLDPKIVAEYKVKQAYAIIKKPVLVEDTSTSFKALNGLPGTFIRFFVDHVGNENICRMLDSFSDRSAQITVTYAFYDGKEVRFFQGVSDGTIPDHPRGTNGHGWDPIFVPQGTSKTHAEMTDAEYEQYVPRKKALIKLEKFLKTLA